MEANYCSQCGRKEMSFRQVIPNKSVVPNNLICVECVAFNLQQKLGSIRLEIMQDNQTEEWSVKWYEDDKLDEGKTYYTDDYQDAVNTKHQMLVKLIKDYYKEVGVL